MNQRIEELAEQVSLELFNDTAQHRLLNGFAEKFAELIIRDVIATIKRTQITGPDFEWVILNNYDLEVEQ